MSGHTPGPWTIEADHEGGFLIKALCDEGNRVIVQRPPWSHRAAESEANARLIAAAPDFATACVGTDDDGTPLDWLSALLIDLRESGPRDDFEDPLAWLEALAHSERLLAVLRAAIAKAEGKS